MGLAGMALSDPKGRLAVLAGFAVFTAFAAATQDVVIDAWRIESAYDAEELDLLTASYKLGYQIAIILTGSVILPRGERPRLGLRLRVLRRRHGHRAGRDPARPRAGSC